MKQYQIPEELEFESLRFCLNNYEPYWLNIREKGKLADNRVFVNEDLSGKVLDFRKDETGLSFLIDSKEIFHIPLRRCSRHFLIEYERTETIEIDGEVIERKINPYFEGNLPEPTSTLLKAVWDTNYIEIAFRSKINIEFHSWWNKDLGWKYWKPVK